jgi:hypothetical protein
MLKAENPDKQPKPGGGWRGKGEQTETRLNAELAYQARDPSKRCIHTPHMISAPTPEKYIRVLPNS